MTAFNKNAERVECYVCGGDGRCSDVSGGVVWRCVRCKGKGTVLVDKRCSGCAGRGCEYTTYGVPIDGSACMYCNGSGAEPRDKRMERLMREAKASYTIAGDRDEESFVVGGMDRDRGSSLAEAMRHAGGCYEDVAWFTGWCVADWQMRKDGQG